MGGLAPGGADLGRGAALYWAMDAEREVRMLYEQLLACWNRRDGGEFAALFAKEGRAIGYDGSAHAGRDSIAADLTRIFSGHATPAYVGLVRGVQFVAGEVAIVDAAAGMVPNGESRLNPALNAVQTLTAIKEDGTWRIVLFQNTPAAYHGRPQMAERLTEDLRAVLDSAGGRWLNGPSRTPRS
jgi:uncharacterized protein (TIGR02246 family)